MYRSNAPSSRPHVKPKNPPNNTLTTTSFKGVSEKALLETTTQKNVAPGTEEPAVHTKGGEHTPNLSSTHLPPAQREPVRSPSSSWSSSRVPRRSPYTRPGPAASHRISTQTPNELAYLQTSLASVIKRTKDLHLLCKNAHLYLNFTEKDIFNETHRKAEYWESIAYQLLDRFVEDLTPFQIDTLNDTLAETGNPDLTIRDIIAQQLGFPPSEKHRNDTQTM